MDITFECPNCNQELEVDSTGSGSQIECPACNNTITIPDFPEESSEPHSSIHSSAAAKEEVHFRVPTNYTGSEVLVQSVQKKTDQETTDGIKRVRVKTIRRSECVEVGKDNFDKEVSKFLGKHEEQDIISVHPVAYSTVELQTQKLVTDYGVLIVFRG